MAQPDWASIFANAASNPTGPVAGAPDPSEPKAYLGRIDYAQGAYAGKTVSDGMQVSYVPDRNREPTVTAATNQIYSWDESKLKNWADLLVKNGLLQPGQYTFENLVSMWSAAVQQSSNFLAAGKKVTPQQYVEMYAGAKGIFSDGSGGGMVDPHKPSTTTSTQTSYQDFNEQDARAMAKDAFASALGQRSTSKKQVAGLEAALDAYARNNPNIVTQTTHNDGYGNTSTTSHTKNGMDSNAVSNMVEDYAQSQPGYGEYQAATTYYNALLQAIQSPVNI